MSDLTDLVAARMEADPRLSDDVKLLVLEAMEHGGEPSGSDCPHIPGERSGTDRPAGAYLKQIAVRGFRGIGPESLLDLHPGPGLTIVAGRNGSGKSSFAEALEVALTGTTYRWSRKAKQWKEAWRNLHTQDAPRIVATLTEEGAGPTRITVEWCGDAVDDTVTSLQRRGEKRQQGISALGWDGPMKTFRPLLTYDELGALLAAEPSRLHDELSTVLGLDQIGDAIKRLVTQSKELAAPGSALTQERRELQQVLDTGDDERLVEARALLGARTVDTAALRSLATGTRLGTDDTAAHLREIAGLSLPDVQAVRSAATRLKQAVSEVAAAGNAASDALERRLDLLNAALRVHDHDGDLVCPVCEQGRLDTARAEVLRRDVETATARLQQLRVARDALVNARRMANALVSPPPGCLARPLSGDLEPLRARTFEAWNDWAATPDGDLALADHLVDRSGPMGDALTGLRKAAEAESASRDRQWADIASRLAAYAHRADKWTALKPRSDAAKDAAKWLKETEVAIKNERMAPIAKKAAEIWAGLRQESNVELAGLSLEGTATRRRVKIATSVDGVDGHGAAVLSQGEIHALALALFLPRATMDESPFRFVVLDDPVQAMDPAKVDGLVSELSRIAKDRQVVVFSHDDRLASAVRRSTVKATIYEVTRETNSKVTVRDTYDPADRYLRDAHAMTRDDGLPEKTLRKVLPGLLRLAAEAAARDRYFGQALSNGAKHAAVETQWAKHQRTSPRISLALYGDVRDLGSWLAKAGYRRTALGICTTAAHTVLAGSPESACDAVKRLVDDIKRGVL